MAEVVLFAIAFACLRNEYELASPKVRDRGWWYLALVLAILAACI